jgi:hypothetical protein
MRMTNGLIGKLGWVFAFKQHELCPHWPGAMPRSILGRNL